jgi:hypothetical protein
MRKWYVPLTVFGISSLGLFLLSERGRNVLLSLRKNFHDAPDRFADLNDAAVSELDHIQAALDRIAEQLGPRPQLGR